MIAKKILNIAIIGTGNVATHLAYAIKDSSHKLQWIVTRNKLQAQAFARKTQTSLTNHIDEVKAVDIVIIAIKDEALQSDYISQLPENAIICHTSGSVPMNVLKNYSKHGIFYPLQTFSKQKKLDFSTVPICLEANSDEVFTKLELLAKDLSDKVYKVNSEQRKALHLAAVFACNFTNLMYDISENLCQESGLDFDILRPLIHETAEKVQFHKPSEVQTGPAARNDKKIIDAHLQLLDQHPDFQNIYKILTQEIIKK
jgi:predicted short-subunit dehydrogenase-like oxidoreductase (DUF2520 family)